MSKTFARHRSRLRDVVSSDGFATLAVGAAVFTDNFMYNVVVPIFPDILSRRIHLPTDQVQFWISLSLAVFGGAFFFFNVVAAYITKRVDSQSKTPFFAGLAFLALSTCLFFLSTDIAPVVAARVLQGGSAAFVWVSGFAFLTAHVDAAYLGTSMALVTAATTGGELVGPLAGSVVYEYGGHFGVLGLCLGIVAVDFLLRIMLRSKPKPDQTLETNGEVRPLLAENGHATTPYDGEGTDSDESLPTASEKPDKWTIYRDIGASWWVILIVGSARSAMEASLPLFVARTFNWSVSASGGVMFAFLSPALVSPLISWFAMRHGPRWITLAFLLVDAAAFIALPFFQHNDTTSKVIFMALIIVIGFAGGAVTTTNTIAFSVVAKRFEKSGESQGAELFGSFSIAWALALLIGPGSVDLFLEFLDWSAFCYFYAGLSISSAIVIAFSWRKWSQPTDA